MRIKGDRFYSPRRRGTFLYWERDRADDGMRGLSRRAILLAFPVFSIVYLLAGGALWAQSFYNYVGQIESQSVLLAWGVTAAEGNTIGRGSTPLGHATVKMAGRAVSSERNWAIIDGL